MKHTAVRLIPYAVNGVIHVNSIRDPALKRLARNPKLTPLIRRALKDIGDQYELLLPYKVDEHEKQLKRYIQYKLGTTVNLTELRRKHLKYYLEVSKYGSPSKVLREWGLGVTYDRLLTEEELLEEVEAIAKNGVVWKVGRNSKLYQSLSYQAKKQEQTVREYLESKGYQYKGGN